MHYFEQIDCDLCYKYTDDMKWHPVFENSEIK